jgi:hypothetical protein
METDQNRQQEGGAHLHALRDQQYFAPLDTVRYHAADQRKQKDRDAAEEGIETQQEGGVGELQHQPALRRDLDVQAPIHIRRKSRY